MRFFAFCFLIFVSDFLLMSIVCFLLHTFLMILAYEMSCFLAIMRCPCAFFSCALTVNVIGDLFLQQCFGMLLPSTETWISGTSRKLEICVKVSQYLWCRRTWRALMRRPLWEGLDVPLNSRGFGVGVEEAMGGSSAFTEVIFWSGFFHLLFLRIDCGCNGPSCLVTVFQSAYAFNGELNQWDVSKVSGFSDSKSMRMVENDLTWCELLLLWSEGSLGGLGWWWWCDVKMVERWCWSMREMECAPMDHCNNVCGLWLTVIFLWHFLMIFHVLCLFAFVPNTVVSK